jgi:hypothetical protein
MSTPPSVDGGRRSATLSRHDVSLVTDVAADKLRNAWALAPLYLYAREPVGRLLRVRSGLDEAAEVGSIEHRQVLPARSIDLGAEGSLEVPPLHAFSLEPARLVTDTRGFTGCLTDTGAIVAEISEDYRGAGGDLTSFKRLQRYPRRRQRVGSVVSLLTGGGGPQTYFHWMYDVLPRIALLEQAGYVREGDRYLVPRLDQRFAHETLTVMGIDPAACVQLEGPTLLEADRMAVSEGHRSYRRVEPWIPRFLRDRLMTEQPQTGRRLYVNRRDTKIRKILNEDRLEVALASRGFESVSLASFSFAEQVRLFASADVVVAPHGAGLSNVAFCPPEASVVEFRDPAWFWPVFGDAARGVNVRYTLVDALSMVGWQRLPPRIRHMLADIDAIMDTVDENLS